MVGFDLHLDSYELTEYNLLKLSKVQVQKFMNFLAGSENRSKIEQLKDMNKLIMEYPNYFMGMNEDNYGDYREFDREA
jgi:hypothetical protein